MHFAGFAITLLDIVVATVFFGALIVGTVADRRGHESVKWWIFIILLGAVAGMFWKDWTLAGVWDAMRSWSFCKPVLYYLAAGIIYSALEFGLEVRKTARALDKAWLQFMKTRSPRTEDERKGAAAEFVRMRWDRPRSIIYLEANGEAVEPHVNKSELAQAIGCWTLLWPAYAISLVVEDVLAEIWNWISSIFIALSGRFVRFTFRDMFKF